MTAEKQSRQLDKYLRQDCLPLQCPKLISSQLYRCLPHRMTDQSFGQIEVKWKSKALLAHVQHPMCSFATLRVPLVHTFSMTVLYPSLLSRDLKAWLKVWSGINSMKLFLNHHRPENNHSLTRGSFGVWMGGFWMTQTTQSSTVHLEHVAFLCYLSCIQAIIRGT